MKKINVLVAGSTGFIGLQLIKLLVKHKYTNIKYLCGNSSVGRNIAAYDQELKIKTLPNIVKFKKEFLKNVDVVFSALPNGDAQNISKLLKKNNIMIDLSGDFRLRKLSEYKKWYKLKHKARQNINKSIYVLPEITKEKIQNYKIISCPGCYPTSILLALAPLIKKNLIKKNNIIIDSKSGYSGAGRGIYKRNKNKNLFESLSVYGVSDHKHNPEINQELKKITNSKIIFSFTPHLIPMFKGILTNIYVDLNNKISIDDVIKQLEYFYKNSDFVKIMKKNSLISTNDVINTNYCKISVCRTNNKNKIIILSTIDNLIKGGAGQAIQNYNKYFNFNISEGLK